jgi:hypothetical protein
MEIAVVEIFEDAKSAVLARDYGEELQGWGRSDEGLRRIGAWVMSEMRLTKL